MKRFLCISLAPALQRTILLDGLRVGEVNRARRVLVSPGGKALNAAWVLRQLGCEVSVAGLNGGFSGAALEVELRNRGIVPEFTRMPGETRVCTSLVDGVCTSEIVQEAPPVGDEVLGLFRADVMRALESGDFDGCCVCGALPGWVSPALYAAWVEAAARRGLFSVVDAWGEPLLRILAREARPSLLKLNGEEARGTWGDAWEAEASAVGCPVLITLGARGALLFEGARCVSFSVEAVEAVNAVGCGDAVTGGILAGFSRGLSLPDAVRLGMACGRANAQTLLPGDLGSFKG